MWGNFLAITVVRNRLPQDAIASFPFEIFCAIIAHLEDQGQQNSL